MLAAIHLSRAPYATAQPQSPAPDSTRQTVQVRAFVDAFNAQDVPRMMTFVTDDVEWVSIDGRAITLEAAGRESLATNMSAYFQSCTSCRSELERIMLAGRRVTALERASWQSKSGERQQRSLSVYEFQGDRIRRVYYFPVEK